MNEDREAEKSENNLRQFALPVILLLMISLVACTGRGQLKPLSEQSDNGLIITDQPQLVTFSELQADPEYYRDQLIRVTGTYIPMLPPDCYPFSGPEVDWALISEGLRLDVSGFDQLKRLISQDTIMTVDGFFRLYEGPIGCGKGAPFETAWYLEILQVVQPNPLVTSGRLASGDGLLELPSPEVAPTDISALGGVPLPIESTEQPTNVPTTTPGGILPAPPTGTSTVTPTGTSVVTTTPTVTPINRTTSGGTGTPSPTFTATSIPGVPTNTPRSGSVPTFPALPTATSGGYPSLDTATPEPY